MQQLPNGATNTTAFDNTLARLGPDATREYKDFDGRTGVNGSPVIVAALTQARNLTVDCQEETQMSGAAANGNWRPSARLSQVYSDRGGVSCLAKAELEAFRIPVKMMQNAQGGFFKEAHRKNVPYTFCGIGPSLAGACTGRIAILTNDWGLAGDAEKGQQPFPVASGGAAQDYLDAVRKIWVPDGMNGANFSTAFAGDAPTDANEFWFSYAGIEVGHLAPPMSGHTDLGQFNTGSPGLGLVPNGSETRCFLGKDHIPGPPCD